MLWDPLGRSVWKGMYRIASKNVRDFLTQNQKDPWFFVKRQVFCSFPVFVFIFLPLIPGGGFLWDWIFHLYGASALFLLFGLLLLLSGWNYAMISASKDDIIGASLAGAFGWEYFGHPIGLHWSQMKQKFPKVFDKGNRKRVLSHQFWGNFQGTDFWLGAFAFTTDRGKGRSVRTTSTSQQVIILNLKNKEFDGVLKEDDSFTFYGQGHVGIVVCKNVFFDDLSRSIILLNKTTKKNKKFIDQKMCSVIRFKDTVLDSFS